MDFIDWYFVICGILGIGGLITCGIIVFVQEWRKVKKELEEKVDLESRITYDV